MELLVSIVVVLLLCVISGITAQTIASGILVLTLFAAGLVLLFFLLCVLNLIGGKVISVRFDRIDKTSEKGFERAFYSDGSTVYPNAFPYEKLLKSFLYIENKQTKVILTRKKNKVYDKMALLVISLGILLSGLSVAFITAYVLSMV